MGLGNDGCPCKGVKITLEDVQKSLRKIVGPEVILVGHGLVHDLKALKFDHLPVIDTAMLFKYKNLPRSTPGLADLCKRSGGRLFTHTTRIVFSRPTRGLTGGK